MDLKTIITQRKTQKVLGDIKNHLAQSTTNYDVKEWLEVAAMAPFHYPSPEFQRTELASILPWRTYVLDANACRKLLSFFEEQKIDSGKIGQMLACCDYLVQVTWLPETNHQEELFEGNIKNMEHIAAASAFIQNLLLLATENETPNYWSSGGDLRRDVVNEYLQIPSSQILLGSVFLFPEEVENAQIVGGAWREKREGLETWSTFRK